MVLTAELSTKCSLAANTLKKALPVGASILFFSLGGMSAANAASFADVVVIIDESGSMAGEQTWVSGLIPSLDTALRNAGVGNGADVNRYGLVGFGSGISGGDLGRTLTVGGGLFGTPTEFSTAASGLVTSGGFEDGYSAIDYALNNYTSRAGAATNYILVTDEDRDNGNNALNRANILSRLSASNILLN